MPEPKSHRTLEDQDEFYRLMWYGDPGTTKTTSIAAVAKLGKVCYLDADNGLKAKAIRRHGIPLGNIEMMLNPDEPLTWGILEDVHREIAMRLADGENIFAVAWDTTTKTQDALLDPAVAESVVKSHRKGAVERTEFEIHLEDRGIVVAQMQKILRRFHRLPCHLLLGAHQRRDQDDDGRVTINPAMSPSVITNFAGWMDAIIHLSSQSYDGDPDLMDGIEIIGLTRPEGRFTAKDRFGLLPKRLINPTADRVIGYLDGDLVRERDPIQRAAVARRAGKAAPAAAPAEAPDNGQPVEKPETGEEPRQVDLPEREPTEA